MTAIDPHEYTSDTSLPLERCAICDKDKRTCELTYKPMETKQPGVVRGPHVVTHPLSGRQELCGGKGFCPACDSPDRAAKGYEFGPCRNFKGLRQWGIYPEPWRRCTECNWPRATHQNGTCTSVVMIAGVGYPCDMQAPHDGWGHSNKEAQAVWI